MNHFNNYLNQGVSIAIGAFLAAVVLGGSAEPAKANDHIFPGLAASKSSIDFDAKGFLINGKREFIVSAGLEYARMPSSQWEDRLLRLKRAGFNCVEIYTFWNWHEESEGKFNFTGDHDLNAFLKLCKKLDMYVIARVGPYYCAEWNLGGYPVWLKFKPDLVLREDNPAFLKYADRFFDHLIPIIAANQINHGGSVILVQLENEHNKIGWGTDGESNPYFKHLSDKALSLGLETPWFFSGLHHGSDPAGNWPLDDAHRPNPWISTEFWSVWYNKYGSNDEDAATYARRTWQIIAHGGNGYNYYMAYGGSNFGYTNNDEDAASYDYGTAVGQAGDLRPIYYEFKRAAWFARSFQEILENSSDDSQSYKGIADNASVVVNARKSPAGTIVFFDNRGRTTLETKVTASDKSQADHLTLAPGEIVGMVKDFQIAPGVTLKWAPARTLAVAKNRNTTTLVIYGGNSDHPVLSFAANSPVTALSPSPGLMASGNTAELEASFDSIPHVYEFEAGGQKVRVIAVSASQVSQVWIAKGLTGDVVVYGPQYLAEFNETKTHYSLNVEIPLKYAEAHSQASNFAELSPIIFGDSDKIVSARVTSRSIGSSLNNQSSIKLAAWNVQDASQPSQPGFDDSKWLASAQPLQMGADQDYTADAWYRASVNVAADNVYHLSAASGGDRSTIYIDGKKIDGSIWRGAPSVHLNAGSHALALFTATDGRDKLYNYFGRIDTAFPKGIMGDVKLSVGSDTPVEGWKVITDVQRGDLAKGAPASGDPRWQAFKIGNDAFSNRPGFAWFETKIPIKSTSALTLSFGSIDDNGVVFFNGKQVARHEGWNDAFDVHIDASQLASSGSEAVIDVFVENTIGGGGIAKPVFAAFQTQSDIPVTNWKMRGGPGDFSTTWQPLGSRSENFSGPVYYQSEFTVPAYSATGLHPILRVNADGLGHGSIWVNGHNLGRYPEKVPAPGLYIPETWLKAGKNSIKIYDEDGALPNRVTISTEINASRIIEALTADKPAGL